MSIANALLPCLLPFYPSCLAAATPTPAAFQGTLHGKAAGAPTRELDALYSTAGLNMQGQGGSIDFGSVQGRWGPPAGSASAQTAAPTASQQPAAATSFDGDILGMSAPAPAPAAEVAEGAVSLPAISAEPPRRSRAASMDSTVAGAVAAMEAEARQQEG